MTDFRAHEDVRQGRPARKGFTLIEMSFVIGLLGLLGLLASYVYIEGVELEAAEMQDEYAVRDVLSIVDALRAYANGTEKHRREFWPTYGDKKCLHMRALNVHGYLHVWTPWVNSGSHDTFSGDGTVCTTTTLRGASRYTTCGTGGNTRCTPYTFIRWDQRASVSVYGRVESGIYGGYSRFGNFTRLEERSHDGGGNGFHLALFFGIPGDYNNADHRARAQALADRLPNGGVLNSAVLTNEIMILVLLFENSSFLDVDRQYVRIDGDSRPVIFRPGRGIFGGMRQIAVTDVYNASSPPLPRSATAPGINASYPRIRMLPPAPPWRFSTQLILMADDTDQQDEAAVVFESGVNHVAGQVAFTVADRLASQRGQSDVTVPHHSLTFGTAGFQQSPLLQLRRRTTSNADERGDVLRFGMRERRIFTNVHDWDIWLKTTGGNHRSVQTRLCALERSTDNPDTTANDPAVPPDAACPQ